VISAAGWLSGDGFAGFVTRTSTGVFPSGSRVTVRPYWSTLERQLFAT